MQRLGAKLLWVDAKPEDNQYASRHGMWLVEECVGAIPALRKLRFVPGPLREHVMDQCELATLTTPSAWSADWHQCQRHNAQCFVETEEGWVPA